MISIKPVFINFNNPHFLKKMNDLKNKKETKPTNEAPPMYFCMKRPRPNFDDDYIILENSEEIVKATKKIKIESEFLDLAKKFKNLSIKENQTKSNPREILKKKPKQETNTNFSNFFSDDSVADIKIDNLNNCLVLQKVPIKTKRDLLYKKMRNKKLMERRNIAMMRLDGEKISLLDPDLETPSTDMEDENLYQLKVIPKNQIKNFAKREKIVFNEKDMDKIADFIYENEHYYTSDQSDEEEKIYKEDLDSNDEDHPNNDYPETPNEFRANSSDSDCDSEEYKENFSDSDDDVDFGKGEEADYMKKLYKKMGKSESSKMEDEDINKYEVYNEYAYDPVFDAKIDYYS